MFYFNIETINSEFNISLTFITLFSNKIDYGSIILKKYLSLKL